LIWANGFGDQSDLDTVYMIGSITKTFTATTLLQLNESNLINLDGDINDYLPFDVRHPDYPSTPITIQMLLTHTAGLARDFDISYYFDKEMIQWINAFFGTNYTSWDPKPSLEEFLNGSINQLGLYYHPDNWILEPGTEFSYSNSGFELLGYLVEQVTNQSIVEYVQENILDPLNMTNSGYNYIDFSGMNAIPYERINESNFSIPFYNLSLNGAGSLRSTVPDLAKYMIAHMNQGEYNGFQLLTPEKIELMHEKHVLIPGSEPAGYGLGWIITDGIQGHDGATPGFLSSMYMKESEHGTFGILVMFNRGSSLILDTELLTEFYPAILLLLLERAENLF
ncbi:MAG: serine hydrolase domain-containing protein, partial [Promethearchaeota archaeon]